MRDSGDVLFFFLILVGVIVVFCAIFFQVQGAVQCAEDGGQYLRTWTGWPTCVMP
jgi:hypothetical protein